MLHTPTEDLEGIPSEYSYGRISNAPTGPSPDADSLYAPDDDSEGNPSEYSTGHISNAPTEPSSDEELLPPLWMTWMELHLSLLSATTVMHLPNRRPTKTTSQQPPATFLLAVDVLAASLRRRTFSTTASWGEWVNVLDARRSIFADRPSMKQHQTPKSPKSRVNGIRHISAVLSSFAAHAAAIRTSGRPVGTPSGVVYRPLPPGKEHGGIPSSSEPRPPSSPPPRAADDPPATEHEQKLSRSLAELATLKRDEAVIHVAASDSSSQLARLSQLAEIFHVAYVDVHEAIAKVEAAEDAWLTYLADLEHDDRAASATARRRYDRFCEEHGLYANVRRYKELRDMLGKATDAAEEHTSRLQALPRHQRNAAFTIYEKMPPVKLYKPPGIPGGSVLKGGRPDKARHGIPCAPSSKLETDSDATLTRRQDQPQSVASKTLVREQTATPAQPRPRCVFCSSRDHWSSDCPTHDFIARWTHVKTQHLCQQCLREGHRPADCQHSNRHCKHCAAHHHAALCPKPHQRFLPSSDVTPNPALEHPSVAVAAGGRSSLGSPARCYAHDDRHSITNPLDTKPPSSSSAQPPSTASVEPPEHRLAKAITSFFQRNSAGSDIVVGFYARSQDDAGRTFYRILKPLEPPLQLPPPANDHYAHHEVERIFMVETTVHLLPSESLLSSSAVPDADSHHSTRRFALGSEGSSYRVYRSPDGVAATDLSGVSPRQAAVMSDLDSAMRTPQLPGRDALSPTTKDSVPDEVEPEDQGTTSRRPRRKRGSRRKQHCDSLSRPFTTSRPYKTMQPSGDMVNAAGPSDSAPRLLRHKTQQAAPTQLSSADDSHDNPEASGIPLDLLGYDDDHCVQQHTSSTPIRPTSERQLPLKNVRTWTASNRKKPLSGPLPSTTTITTPHTTEAHHSPARIARTAASGIHASGSCQKRLLECARAYVRYPFSAAPTPIFVLYDANASHSSCSTKLALDLRLQSIFRTDTSRSDSRLPDIITNISIVASPDGGPDDTITVTLAPMPVCAVSAASLPLTPIRIIPHVVIGRTQEDIFRRIVSRQPALKPLSCSSLAGATPIRVQRQSILNGIPCEIDVSQTHASCSSSSVYPSSGPNGIPVGPVLGSRCSDAPPIAEDAGTPAALTITQGAGPLADLDLKLVQVIHDIATDYEPSGQGVADAEGIPLVADIPYPAQEQPRTRPSKVEPSGVEIIERDDSPGVTSSLSGLPAPGQSSDVLSPFQHLTNTKNIQPDLQPQFSRQTLALLFPQAGTELLDKLWNDYQKVPLNSFAVDPSGAEAAGTAVAVPQSKPSEAQFNVTDEVAELNEEATRQRLQERHYADESLSQPDCSSPEYTPLPDNYVPYIDEAFDQELSDNDEQQGVSPPGADGNSPQPMDTEATPTTETRNSEAPATADEATGGTTGRTTSPSPVPEVETGLRLSQPAKPRASVLPLNQGIPRFNSETSHPTGHADAAGNQDSSPITLVVLLSTPGGHTDYISVAALTASSTPSEPPASTAAYGGSLHALQTQTQDVSRFLNVLHQLRSPMQTPTWLRVYPTVEAVNLWGVYKHLTYSTVHPMPDSDAETDAESEDPAEGDPHIPDLERLSVAVAAGGRSPPDALNSQHPGKGHNSGAVAAGGRSPPERPSSDTIRIRNSSTEQRRGTPRASSRGPPTSRSNTLPWLGEGRQGQHW